MTALTAGNHPLVRAPQYVGCYRPLRLLLAVTLAVLALMHAISTVNAASAVPAVKFTVNSYVVEGENPLTEAYIRETLTPFTGEHSGLAVLQSAARALDAALKNEGHAFYRVTIPPQRAAGGVFRLKILSFRLSRIEVRGNEHFSEENITASLPGLEPGKTPDSLRLLGALPFANTHPAKRVRVTFRESRAPDAVDALIDVVETNPERAFVSLSNRGSASTGRFRLLFGYQHANLFDRDHILTASYTTSPGHVADVRQLGASYQIPLYELGGRLDFVYAQSTVDSGSVANAFDVSGSGTFFGVRYTHSLPKLGPLSQSAFVGLDDRLFENDVKFQGTPIGTDVRSRPLTIGYSAQHQGDTTSLGMFASWSINLDGGRSNDAGAYAANRTGASEDWMAVRYGANVTHEWSDGWRMLARLSGQHAAAPLVSGEQFGIGGAVSLRGIEERGTAGDSGQLLSVEAWLPPFDDSLQALAFVDVGRVGRKQPQAGERAREIIGSLGLGLRWQFAQSLSLQLDVARVMRASDQAAQGSGSVHMDVSYRF